MEWGVGRGERKGGMRGREGGRERERFSQTLFSDNAIKPRVLVCARARLAASTNRGRMMPMWRWIRLRCRSRSPHPAMPYDPEPLERSGIALHVRRR